MTTTTLFLKGVVWGLFSKHVGLGRLAQKISCEKDVVDLGVNFVELLLMRRSVPQVCACPPSAPPLPCLCAPEDSPFNNEADPAHQGDVLCTANHETDMNIRIL